MEGTFGDPPKTAATLADGWLHTPEISTVVVSTEA